MTRKLREKLLSLTFRTREKELWMKKAMNYLLDISMIVYS